MPAEYIVDGRTPPPWEIDAHVDLLAERLPRHADVVVHALDRLAFLCTLLAGERRQCRVLAAPSYWSAEQFASWAGGANASALVRRGSQYHLEIMPLGSVRPPVTPGLVIFTSGSTGVPKGVEHSWASAAASGEFTSERLRGKTWYLAYEPAGYAGLQVLYAARASEGRLVMPPHGIGFSEHARLIALHGVSVISATPTWWRMLISAWPDDLAAPKLAQATLGGEVVDQGTLDLVSRFFEPEQLTHVYASSEAGTAIAVSDRLAGFPARYLEDPRRRIGLRVRDGVLEVRSPFRMRGYLRPSGSEDARPADDGSEGEWVRTGDLIEQRGDRCHFVGREDQQLNIGGLKVKPEEVEEALLRLPGVRDCVAYGRTSPIVGTLLAADVVPEDDASIDSARVRELLKQMLPLHKIPQQIRFVKQLTVSANGKKQRSAFFRGK